MNKDIQFLKDLQEELKTQDHDCQAEPRYWTVGDYKMIGCPEGCHDTYHIGLPNRDYYDDLDNLLKDIKEEINESQEYSEDAKEEFKEIECEDSAIAWIKEHYDEDAYLIPVREEHIVHPNTMFLTKAEAKRHIELNHYHYSPKAHTYAMTAWRAPKVERLIKILETFDWDSLGEKTFHEKIKVHAYCGFNTYRGKGLFEEPAECSWEDDVYLDKEDWKDGFASIKCPVCKNTLTQDMYHFEIR